MILMMMICSGLFFLGAILALVDWRKLAEKWVQDNPAKAHVYVRAGEHEDRVNGKLIYASPLGSFYEYRWCKANLISAVPGDYPYIFLRGKRKINVLAGHAVTSLEFRYIMNKHMNMESREQEVLNRAEAETLDMKTLPNTQSSYDLNALIKGQVAVELVKSLFGKKLSGWLIIFVILGAMAIGYFLYSNFMKTDEVPPEQSAEQERPAKQERPKEIEGVPVGWQIVDIRGIS